MAKGPRSESDPSAIAQRRATAQGYRRRAYVDRRQEIIGAAADVFKQRGFQGTTLSHVAEAMDTDRASLYYYFASKDELFQEVVDQAVSVNLETAIAIRDEGGSAVEKLRRLIVALMQSYADFYPVLYLVIQENLSHVAPERSQWASEVRAINNEFMDVLIEIVADGQRDGTLRATSPAWLEAYGVMGIVGWTNRWFNPADSTMSAAEIGEVFANMVLQGLSADPTGTGAR